MSTVKRTKKIKNTGIFWFWGLNGRGLCGILYVGDEKWKKYWP